MNIIFLQTVLAKVASETRPGVVHEIHMGEDGNIYCTCEAWKFQKRPVIERTCKHLQAFAKVANLPHGSQKTPKVAATVATDACAN